MDMYGVLKMKKTNTILLEIESWREDGKFVENETEHEFTLEEAADVVIDIWDDVPGDYYSWNLKKVIFKHDESR